MPEFENVINHSKRLGIDECEIVSLDKKTTTVRITDSKIAELKQNSEKSFGVRVINNKKITSCQLFSADNLESEIEKLLYSPIKKSDFWQSLPDKINTIQLEGTFDPKLDNIEGTKIIDIAQTMINSALGDNIKVSGSLNIISENFDIVNSNGLFGSNKATYISGMINSESRESGFGQQCCRTLDKFSAESIGNDSKTMCLESASPKQCNADKYTILLEPYSVGELLAFVASPNFNLRYLADKKSCFADKLEKQIAIDDCTILDDPHVPQGIGTKPFDDEGVNTKPNRLINQGIFENVFSNLYDSFKEDYESTGNAARNDTMGRSANPIPYSMPHNLCVAPGSQSIHEMIKETRHGLLIGRLWYTYALNPIRGDFSCTARSGIQIIENGQIKHPAKPVRIIYNLPAILQSISGIGKDVKNVMPWASIPSITPAIKFDHVPVTPI